MCGLGKAVSSTLLWSCLFFNFTQFKILENLSFLNLALTSESVNFENKIDIKTRHTCLVPVVQTQVQPFQEEAV